MIGINDIGKDVPLEGTEKYYRLIIDKFQKQIPECRIVLQSVLPTLRADGINDQVVRVNQMIAQIASEFDVEYIDMFSDFMNGDAVNSQYYSADLVHLNGSGYKVWMDILRNQLQ